MNLPPGFTDNIHADDALALAIFGEQGSGKTRFACTAPDPIGFIPLDRKTRKTVERWMKEFDKKIIMPKADFIRVGNAMQLAKMDEREAKKHYRQHVDAIKEAAFRMYDIPEVRTVVIDTGTQLWEDMLFAEYGRSQRIMPRDRGPANQEMIDFLNFMSGKHLILTHKAQEIWKNDKPTGKNRLQGFPHLGYHVNVIAELQNNPTKTLNDSGCFIMNVSMCQDNPEIQGPNGKELLLDEEINFQMLAMKIYPESEWEQWV